MKEIDRDHDQLIVILIMIVFTPIEIFGTQILQECAREGSEELAKELIVKRMRATSENEKQQCAESFSLHYFICISGNHFQVFIG